MVGVPLRGSNSRPRSHIRTHTIFAHINYSTTRTIESVKIHRDGKNFQNFALQDLKRLKVRKTWLSDPHVTLLLLFVPFCLLVGLYLTEIGIAFCILKA